MSDVVDDAANMMQRKNPFPEQVTAVGLGSGEDFGAASRSRNTCRSPPTSALPFADRRFDIATSNAVLEHVGSLPSIRNCSCTS